MKKLATSMIGILSLSMILTACGDKEKNEQKEPGAAETHKTKIGIVLDQGGIDDGFNKNALEGLERLEKEKPVEKEYLLSRSAEDYLPNLNKLVDGDYDLIWGNSFNFTDSMTKVSKENPTKKFGIIDSVIEGDNVVSVVFKEQEGSYLAGIVAGLTTKTNKVGFIGGMDIPVINRFKAGFEAGVKEVNPDAEVIVVYADAFDDPSKGSFLATDMFNKDVDVVFPAAGATGDGVFLAAKEKSEKEKKQVWVIGVDKDQSVQFGHEVTLTSMMKYLDEAIYQLSKKFTESGFEPGVVSLGLKENGVGLPENNPNVSKDILAKVDEYKEKIISGEIVVPEK